MAKKSIRNKSNQAAAKKNTQVLSHVPGVPESNEAFELSLVAFQPGETQSAWPGAFA